MHKELLSALCLVLVIEGLMLFAAPHAWKRFMEQMRHFDERSLRLTGGVMVAIGLIALKIIY